MQRKWLLSHIIFVLIFVGQFQSIAFASEWTINKTSGLVWLASSKAKPAALSQGAVLSAGDTLQTGVNGRVLLVRNDESISVGPNTVLSLPDKADDSGMTRILQQSGSISVKAQKREVEHFEVLTPYLAAVVKGTEFSVTLAPQIADVQVITGEVEVAQFQTGQTASIRTGQAARAQGERGLALRGSGVFDAIREGEPVRALLKLIEVPKNGFRAPLRKAGRVVRTVGRTVERSFKTVTRAAATVPFLFGAVAQPNKRRSRP